MTDFRKFAWDMEKHFGARYWGISPYLEAGWVVIYEDGLRSRPMLKGHAFDYASMFNAPSVIKTRKSREQPKHLHRRATVETIRVVMNPYYKKSVVTA